jgi:hypothetical protein
MSAFHCVKNSTRNISNRRLTSPLGIPTTAAVLPQYVAERVSFARRPQKRGVVSLSLSFDLIEKVAEQEKEQLTADAVRTIRQKDPERGMGCLNQIEGIDRFLEALRRACCSSYYRQLGAVSQEEKPRKVSPIRKKGVKPSGLRIKEG